MKKRKRHLQQKKFITMDNNSYAQLIDDFEEGLLVIEGESLTDYISRMGGVDYDAKANGGRIGYADGGLMSPEEYFKGKEKYMKEEQIENMRREYNEYLYKQKNGPRDEAANGGIMGYASGGGIQNLSDVYNNSSVLQDKYSTQQDYLDLFDQRTTTTPTTSTTTITDLIEQAPETMLPPRVRPLLIPQTEGGDGGGGITNNNLRTGYGYDSLAKNTLDEEGAGGYKTKGTDANIAFLEDIGVATIADEDYTPGMRFGDFKTGILNATKYLSPFNKSKLNIMNFYKKGKEIFNDRSNRIVAEQKEIALAKAKAFEEEMARRENERNQMRVDYGGTIDAGNRGGYGGTGSSSPSAVSSQETGGRLGGGV